MTFARYFKISSYSLIASGFVAISSTGSLDGIAILLFAAVLICSWFLDTARIRQNTPTWVLNGLGLIYLPFCALDYLFLSRSFLLAVTHLLLFAAATKLLTLSKDQDYILLYLISLAQMLAASILTVNLVFALCFVAFLLSGISTLIVFEMRRTNAKVLKEASVQPVVVPPQLRGTGMELFSPFPAGLMVMMVMGIALLILVVAVPIFLLLPRVTLGLNKRPSGSLQFTSGFSERVELGQIGNIKQSDTVVMRVKTDRSPSELPADLKWRGIAFEYFDGRTWKKASSRSRGTIPAQGWHYKLENSTQGTNWINQTFFLEALSTDVVFATRKALAVSKDVGPLLRDSADNLFSPRPPLKKLRYSVVSDPIRPDPVNISDQRPIPPDILAVYTQVPPEDPRIEALAKRITAGATDRYSKALALEKHLRSRYGYSLVLRGTPHHRDPLAMFLFDVQSGHCEYFASAMAIMLRQLGIPARLVNGFRAGEYNQIGKSWTVRQYHAHSWVEAYFPPYGWIEFDPTPTESGRQKSGWLLVLAQLADAVDLWWWDSVVNYDIPQQSAMLRQVREKAERSFLNIGALAERIQAYIRRHWQSSRLTGIGSYAIGRWDIGILVMAAAVFLLVRPVRRRIRGAWQRTLHRSDSRRMIHSFYMEALSLLAAEGMRPVRGQTPLEFAQTLETHPAGRPFLSLTQIYNAIRFGPPGVPFQSSEPEALLHSLRSVLKRKPQSPYA